MVKDYKDIIRKYFEKAGFVEASLNSFDNFIDVELQKITEEIGDIKPTITPENVEDFVIKLNKIWVGEPQLIEADGSKRVIYPMEARLRKLTYSAPLFLEVSAYVDGMQIESFTTQVGKIPIMIRSKHCNLHGLNREELIEIGEDPDDLGGYFILNGNERVLVMVEDLASNRLFVEKSSVGTSEYTLRVFSESGALRIPHTLEQLKDGVLNLTFTRFKRVPIMAVIKALGLTRDQDIMEIIGEKEYEDIFINMYRVLDLKTQDDALEFLGKHMNITQGRDIKIERAREFLDRYLLPHLGSSEKVRLDKAYNLCKMIKRFLMIAKEGYDVTDKDHYLNKRIKLPGDLLADLLRVNMRVLVNDMLYNFQRLVKRGKFNSIKIIIRDKLLTGRITSAMATGSWPGGRQGVSQNIDRTNFLGTSSHLSRIVSLLSATQENFEARALHGTHWGKLCLKKDTNVLLADNYSNRTLEMLQNCWHHHKVSTFDNEKRSLTPSAISKYYTSNPKLLGKRTYKLVSEAGREITATEDHPLYTKKGWTEMGNLKIGDEIAVYPCLDPVEIPELPNKNLGFEIVNEKTIVNNYPNRFKHYIKELQKNELLPLTVNNYKIEIIARLMGHLFSDGHCGKYNLEFYCGDRRDAENISRDIRLLGFEPSKITEKNTKIKIEKRTVNYRTFTVTKGGALHSLLICAGAPAGRKTDSVIKIPNWLFESSLAVKREFLGALLGGDGPKPRVDIRKDRKSGSKVSIEGMVFHKALNLEKNALEFLSDIKKLFNEFEIAVKRTEINKDYIRKDGVEMLKCKLVFGRSHSNIKNLLNKVGYRYCVQKEADAKYIGEWLRLRDSAIMKRYSLKENTRKMHKDGIKPKKISEILGVKYRVVKGWLYDPIYNKTRLSQNLLLPYNEWLKNVKFGDDGIVWQKIVLKKEEELDDVRDFTTVENTHSFIANGFVTHNCPIETPEGTSIGLRKNLAMLCKISPSNKNKEKVQKVLEELGLEGIK